MTDLRVLIVSAKLLVGPATQSGTRKTRPAGPTRTRRTYFALYYTAGVNREIAVVGWKLRVNS